MRWVLVGLGGGQLWDRSGGRGFDVRHCHGGRRKRLFSWRLRRL